MGKAKRKLVLVSDGGMMVNAPPQVPVILADPKATTLELKAMTHHLGNRSGAVKQVLRDVRPTLDQEQERLRLYGAQQPPGWASVRIAQHALHIVTTVESFVDQVNEAQALLERIRPSITESLAHIKQRRQEGAKIVADVDALEDFAVLVDRTVRMHSDLEHFITQVTVWLTVAKESAARTAEAAGRAVSSAMVVDLSTALRQMAERVQALRETSSPALREVLEAVRKAEAMNETHIRLPAIVWPVNGNLFDPPKLREWNEDD